MFLLVHLLSMYDKIENIICLDLAGPQFTGLFMMVCGNNILSSKFATYLFEGNVFFEIHAMEIAGHLNYQIAKLQI